MQPLPDTPGRGAPRRPPFAGSPPSPPSRPLPISSVLDQGAALRAARGGNPAGGKPPRPPPAPGRRATDYRRTAAPSRLIRPAARSRPGGTEAEPVGLVNGQGFRLPRQSNPGTGLPPVPLPQPATPHRGPLSRSPHPRTPPGEDQTPTAAFTAPEEPSGSKIDLPTICPQPVVDGWTQPDSAGPTTTAPAQHSCWSGAVGAPGGG